MSRRAGVERQVDLDGRRPERTSYAITGAGRQALARDMGQRDAWLAEAMAGRLTQAEQELLRIAGGLLDRLADAGEPEQEPEPRPGGQP